MRRWSLLPPLCLMISACAPTGDPAGQDSAQETGACIKVSPNPHDFGAVDIIRAEATHPDTGSAR